MPRVILYQPQIPQNTGNVARTCAATHTPLHLVEPLGFQISDRHLKRAGLDYWHHVDLRTHGDLNDLRECIAGGRWVCFSARSDRSFHDFEFMPGDCLFFGSETRGLPDFLLNDVSNRVLRVPLDRGRVRSLNLATTVGVVLYEAIRQLTRRDGHGFRAFDP